MAADLSPSSTVLVKYTLPGRAPVIVNTEEDLMVSPDRGGMKIIVRRKEGTKYVESQVLARHDMIVNSLVMRGDFLVSAGWDSRVVVWVSLISRYLPPCYLILNRLRGERGTSSCMLRTSSWSPTSTPCVPAQASHSSLEERKVI